MFEDSACVWILYTIEHYNFAPPLPDIDDSWGGSYLMEALTDQVYESALNIINEVQGTPYMQLYSY